jgi:hypothetical protein
MQRGLLRANLSLSVSILFSMQNPLLAISIVRIIIHVSAYLSRPPISFCFAQLIVEQRSRF